MKNYYVNQLEQLKDSEYYKTIKLVDSFGNTTKVLNLNSDSIPVLISYLKKELERVKNE